MLPSRPRFSAWLLLIALAVGGVVLPVAHAMGHVIEHADAAHGHDADDCLACLAIAQASSCPVPTTGAVPTPPPAGGLALVAAPDLLKSGESWFWRPSRAPPVV